MEKPDLNDEETLMFDPLTGEPINNDSKQQEQDTIPTKEPEVSNAEEQETPNQGQPTGFDPMTGQPIYGEQTPDSDKDQTPKPEQPTGFDPMTGQPIYGGQPADSNKAQTPNQGQPTGYDPMTGQPIYGDTNAKPKKKKLPAILGGIVAAVVVIAIIATIVIKLATPTYAKVLLAINNTFKDKPYIVEDLSQAVDIVSDKKFTVGATGEIDGNTITTEAICSGKRYQASVAVDGDDVEDFSAIVDLDSDYLSLYAPKLSKKVMQYDYNKNASGYISELISSSDLSMINSVLKGVVHTGNGEELKGDLYDALKNSLKELEFEKLDSDTFEVDDKDVDCKGYRVKITKSFVKTFLKEVDDIMSERSYANTIAKALDYKDFGDLIDDLKDEFDDMDTVKVSFYIYKNKLASVSINIDNETLEVNFKGGDYRIQNIDIKGKDSSHGKYNIMRIEGSTNKNKEETTFTVWNGYNNSSSNSYTMEYNTKTGALSIDFGKSIFQFEGNIDSSSSKLEIEIESICIDGSRVYPDNCSVYVSNSTKFEKLDTSKTFDVGKAEKDEWYDLIDDIQDGLYDIGLGNISYYRLMSLFK